LVIQKELVVRGECCELASEVSDVESDATRLRAKPLACVDANAHE
jgi:hypothetical protein